MVNAGIYHFEADSDDPRIRARVRGIMTLISGCSIFRGVSLDDCTFSHSRVEFKNKTQHRYCRVAHREIENFFQSRESFCFRNKKPDWHDERAVFLVSFEIVRMRDVDEYGESRDLALKYGISKTQHSSSPCFDESDSCIMHDDWNWSWWKKSWLREDVGLLKIGFPSR